MARKVLTPPGGVTLADSIKSFMQANLNDMKSSGKDRNASSNESIGLEDMANAIAYGINEALKQNFALTSTAMVVGTATGPATGVVTLTGMVNIFK